MPNRIYIEKDLIQEYYYDKKLSLAKTAKAIGYSVESIVTNMKHYGMKTRDLSESHLGQHSSPATQFKKGCKPSVNGFRILHEKVKANGCVDSELLFIEYLKKMDINNYKMHHRIYTEVKHKTQGYYHEIDFAFINDKIAVEIDGNSHDKRRRPIDERKDRYLTNKGWRVIRITNTKLKFRENDVLEILETLKGAS